jgi:hypothetical protein
MAVSWQWPRACFLRSARAGTRRHWGQAQALAKDVADDPRNALARGVLEGGPFAMRKAEELAELVLGEGDAFDDEGEQGANGR